MDNLTLASSSSSGSVVVPVIPAHEVCQEYTSDVKVCTNIQPIATQALAFQGPSR